jgi:hypothetical protein
MRRSKVCLVIFPANYDCYLCVHFRAVIPRGEAVDGRRAISCARMPNFGGVVDSSRNFGLYK